MLNDTVGAITAPVNLLGGWYDIFLPQILADYTRLRQVGKQPYLTIGHWTHGSPGMFGHTVREALAWFRTHLLGEQGLLRQAPVHVFVMGRNEWRAFPDWPPAGYEPQPWFLQRDHQLPPQPPTTNDQPDHYRYDPADPTPAVGGSSLSQNAGPKDRRSKRARMCWSTPVQR